MTEPSRDAAFRGFAESNGLEYTTQFDRSDLRVSKPFSAFDGWLSGSNLVRAESDVGNLQFFDMSRTTTSQDVDGRTTTSTSYKTSIVVENRTDVPDLRLLASRGIAAGLFNMAGRLGLEFAPDSGFPEDSQVVRRFNQTYFVDGEGFEAGVEFRETPDGISLRLVKELVDGRGWSIEVLSEHILIQVDQKLVPKDELSKVLEEARTIIALLQDLSPTGLSVRRLPPAGMTTLIGGLIWPFGGAIVGLVTTMVVFGLLYAVLGDLPTAVILSFPLVGMGFMLSGVFVAVRLRNRFHGDG